MAGRAVGRVSRSSHRGRAAAGSAGGTRGASTRVAASGTTVRSEATSEQGPQPDGGGGDDRGKGHQVEGGGRDHVHAETPGAVRDGSENDPEDRQAEQLERFGVCQAEE